MSGYTNLLYQTKKKQKPLVWIVMLSDLYYYEIIILCWIFRTSHFILSVCPLNFRTSSSTMCVHQNAKNLAKTEFTSISQRHISFHNCKEFQWKLTFFRLSSQISGLTVERWSYFSWKQHIPFCFFFYFLGVCAAHVMSEGKYFIIFFPFVYDDKLSDVCVRRKLWICLVLSSPGNSIF